MKKRYYVRKQLVVYLWIAGFSLAPGSIPYGAEPEKKEEEEVPVLQEVVVTATRQEKEIRKIPANVTVITEEDIENSNAKNVADLLRSEQGIVVRDLLGNGKNAQVDMRGFGETGPFNTLVMVDGRRINQIDLSGVDWTQIPLDQIQRIEIVRGTGSVLYGDNAVGGMINIITKPPAKKMAAAAGSTVGSYDRIKGKASVSGGQEIIGGSLSVSYEETDGYRRNNEFRTRDVGGKIVLDGTDYLSFTLSGSHHRDDFGLPGPLTEGQLHIDRQSTTRPFDEGETTDQYIALGGDWDLGEYGRVVCDFSFRDRDSDAEFVSSTSETASHPDTLGVEKSSIMLTPSSQGSISMHLTWMSITSSVPPWYPRALLILKRIPTASISTMNSPSWKTSFSRWALDTNGLDTISNSRIFSSALLPWMLSSGIGRRPIAWESPSSTTKSPLFLPGRIEAFVFRSRTNWFSLISLQEEFGLTQISTPRGVAIMKRE